MFKSPPPPTQTPPPPPPLPNRKKIIKNSVVRKKAVCETVRLVISFKPRTATRKGSARYVGAPPILEDYV